jgi:nitric oxide reductase activation protein
VDKKRQRKRKLSFVRRREQGMVDSRRLWKLCAGSSDVFMQRRIDQGRELVVDPDSLAFYLLIDESHSMMESGRYVYAREAAIILGEALDNLSIAFAMTGYTSSSRLQRILYKEFGEGYTNVKTRLIGIDHRMGTMTAEHIPFAVRRLEKRSERMKILVVVTDATDIESPVRLRNAILDAEEAEVGLIGVGVHTNLMSQWFEIFIEITDIRDFARGMLEMLRNILQR